MLNKKILKISLVAVFVLVLAIIANTIVTTTLFVNTEISSVTPLWLKLVSIFA